MSSSERQNPSDEAAQKRRLVIAGSLSLALVAVAVVVIGAVSGGSAAGAQGAGASDSAASSAPRPVSGAAQEPAAVDTFDRTAFSLDDPNSIWVVVNKLRPMNPQDFEPEDLVDVDVPHTWDPMMRQEAADAVVAMFQAASDEAGLTLASNSAFRSYSSQESIYDGDDLLTARPGFSEHQTGLVMDIGAESGDCSLATCFADTDEGIWLRDNAWRFGFILRYPADKTPVTGYEFEPWHYRYVGVPLATEMHDTGITTLEEFFGLPAAPEYE